MNARRAAGPTAVLIALALAPAASAHVTVNPAEWEADGFARFAVRVPNERDDAATTRVTMQFPEQVLSASFQPVEGWRRTVEMENLDEPVEVDGDRVTERIDTVTWSGGRIEPGEFQEFGISLRVPDDPGSELVFPAVQRYSNREVVRWIGPADADAPAPRVAVVEAAAPASEPPATALPEAGESADGGGGETMATIALAIAIVGLLTAIAAIAWRRPRGST